MDDIAKSLPRLLLAKLCRWSSRATAVAALVAAIPCAADLVAVRVPPGTPTTLLAGTLSAGGRLTSPQRVRADSAGDAMVELGPVPPTGVTRYGVFLSRSDGLEGRALLEVGPEGSLPSELVFREDQLYEPCTVSIDVGYATRGGARLTSIVVTESDGHVHAHSVAPTHGTARLVLDGVRPGLLVVCGVSDTGLGARTSANLAPGSSEEVTLFLSQRYGPGPAVAPIFATGGDVPEGLYSAVSTAIFVLVVAVWAVLATCFPILWGHFGLRERLPKAVLSAAAAVIGIVMLGNGIGLLVLQELRYLPLVAAVAATQLVFLTLTVVAYASRQPWARSLSVLGVVFSLLASLAFLPSFALEEDPEIGLWLTVAELILVCGASLALTATVIADRRGQRTIGVPHARREPCNVCGGPRDPLTGRCDCLPESAGRPGRRVARLSVLYADGRRGDLLVGPHSTIGRDPACDICLSGDPRASSVHAILALSGGKLTLSDRGSANGTFVNGERISEREIRDGDEFTIGDTWFVVEVL